MGLFDFKNTLSKVAKGVSDTVSNILEYEMEYDIHPTTSDSYSGYYESFHNYLDTHLNEWSNNKYNIFEMLAIHDVLDEILIYFWEPNFNYKETKIDLRLPEDFGNEYDITIGYLHYLRMLMMLVKNQEEFDDDGFLPENQEYAETMTSPQEDVEKYPRKYIIEKWNFN